MSLKLLKAALLYHIIDKVNTLHTPRPQLTLVFPRVQQCENILWNVTTPGLNFTSEGGWINRDSEPAGRVVAEKLGDKDG